jgi:uncharacterized protein (DUF1697 family)
MRSGPGKTARHIALLRGINLGGRNSLPMARLVSIFETIGCQGVRTYIQSGNVVFEAPATLARQVPGLVADAIADQTGLAVPIMTRSAAEIQRLVDANPFVKPGADLSVLHVGFLAARPTRAHLAALDPDRSPPDECVSDGRELYLRCPNGLARTKFTNAYFDRTLGTVTTIRNWRTTLRLLELAAT